MNSGHITESFTPAELDAIVRGMDDPRWELRGQPRTRATFAAPHPADFRGGLPQPQEYPG